MAFADADAHVVETERVWNYLDGSERKFRTTLVMVPDNPKRQYWMLDGENLGNKFPAPDEKQSAEHVKKFGREVDTPVQARELTIDIQVLYNSLWITPLTGRPDVEIALSWAWNRWLADVWKQGEGRLRWTCVVPALTPREAVAQDRIGTDYGHGDTSSELNAIARFKAMKNLTPQIKRKILSDNPRRFYGI